MAELYLPDIGQTAMTGMQAGMNTGLAIKRMTANRDAAGLMGQGDYQGAAEALYGAGDFQGGTAVATAGYTQTEQRLKMGRQLAVQQALKNNDLSGAYQAAEGDPDLTKGLDGIWAHAKDTTATLGAAVDSLKSLPYGQRVQAYQTQIKPQLAARGLPAQQLDSFDPTDQNIASIETQVIGLDKQLEMTKPVAVDDHLVIPTGPNAGKSVYDAPKVMAVQTPAGGQNVVSVPTGEAGGAAPGGAPGAPPPQADPNLPRGLRNNNPLNLTALPQGHAWGGQTGTDGKYVTFDTPQSGWAAADQNLQAYATHHGIDTVSGIVGRWAPAGADGNDPTTYAATVAKQLGVDSNAHLNLSDPGMRQKVLEAMAGVENGRPVPFGAGANPAAPQGVAQSGDAAGPGVKVLYSTDDGESTLSNDAVQMMAGMYLRTGQLPPLGMKSQAVRQRILNAATQQAHDLGLNAGDIVAGTVDTKAQAKALGDNETKVSQIEGFEDTASRNADLALSLAPKGGAQGQVPVLNRWIQYGRKQIAGDPDVAKFDIALGTFADEYAKVVAGQNGATDSVRAEAYHRINNAMTQQQLQQVVATMKQEMANRTMSMQEISEGIRARIRNGGATPVVAAAPASQPAPAGLPPLTSFYRK